MNTDAEEVKNISIKGFLEGRGVKFEREGSKFKCSSPLSEDSTPSFYYYPSTNTFYDFANGVGGDIIKLVEEVDNLSFIKAIQFLHLSEFPEIDCNQEEKEIVVEPFVKGKYLIKSEFLRNKIRQYALYRGIVEGYYDCKFAIRDKKSLIRRLGVGFLHTDYYGEEVGMKIRDINPYNGRRFTLRGSQMFYCLESHYSGKDSTPLYLVESETSANSLYTFLKVLKKPAVVISIGSWNNVPEDIPVAYKALKNRLIVIDYDGNEELYQERISRFNHLNGSEVKLELDKGEDINSLFCSGKLFNFKNQILL